MSKAQELFNVEAKNAIINAIKEAEKLTSGEIKVYVEDHCEDDVFSYAKKKFFEIEMEKTKERNGVLLYVAIVDHKLAIIGDEGIYKQVRENFWDLIRDQLIYFFKQEKYVDGIEVATKMIGEQLQSFFPRADKKENELTDEIIIK